MARQQNHNLPGSKVRAAGFTLVELVVVIVLLGIMAAVVISRYTGPNAFNALGAQDALVAGIRQAQQAALGRQDVSFEIDSTGAQHRFIVKSGVNELSRTVASKNGVLLSTGTAEALSNPADSCGSGTRFSTTISTLKLGFDKLGNLTSFDRNAAPTENNDGVFDFNGVRICVNATVAASVCVSPAGYAYEGNCEP